MQKMSKQANQIAPSGDIVWERDRFVSKFEKLSGHTRAEGKYLGVFQVNGRQPH